MRVALVEVGHILHKPAIYRLVEVVPAHVGVVDCREAEVGHHIAVGVIEPRALGQVAEPWVSASAVVENHVHYHLHAALVSLGDEIDIILVCAKSGIYAIIVGSGISVVGTTGHIVFEYRVEPYCSHSERVDISEVVGNTFQVAAMTSVRLVAVDFHRVVHRGNHIVCGVAIGKAVGHD